MLRKHKKLFLLVAMVAVVYYGIYLYSKDKITPLQVSSYVNYYDSDLALQVAEVEYIFPSWLIMKKGTLFYKQEPVFNFDKAKITLSLFSIFWKEKRFKFDIFSAGGKIDGRYSGDKLEIDAQNIDLSLVPLTKAYELKGDLDLKLDLKLKDGKVKNGGCNALVENVGFSGVNDYVTDTSLNLGSVFVETRVNDDDLEITRFEIVGKELNMQSLGRLKFLEDNRQILELKGKKQFAPTFFEKIENGFFVGLYFADAIGKDCYFMVDYSDDGLDYRQLSNREQVERLEKKLQEKSR